jgi:hypothetical protein
VPSTRTHLEITQKAALRQAQGERASGRINFSQTLNLCQGLSGRSQIPATEITKGRRDFPAGLFFIDLDRLAAIGPSLLGVFLERFDVGHGDFHATVHFAAFGGFVGGLGLCVAVALGRDVAGQIGVDGRQLVQHGLGARL